MMRETRKIPENETVEPKENEEIGMTEDTENENPEAGETDPEEEPGDIQKELETAKQEASDNLDRFLRTAAELENYKKRMTREMEGLRKFATESIIKQLLPVVDNLERAIESEKMANGTEQPTEESNNRIIEGVGMTLAEILKVFEKFGVQPIRAVGETFDPKFHEAVLQEETENGEPNVILREFQKGYMMHDRLLRPTMVVVSKPKTENTDAETEPSENEE